MDSILVMNVALAPEQQSIPQWGWELLTAVEELQKQRDELVQQFGATQMQQHQKGAHHAPLP
eukprot:4294066-Prorocentrum_lima.AAC.1